MAGSISVTTNQATGKRATDAAKAQALIIPASEGSTKLKMCVYARNKVGKTRFACSSQLRTLVIDCNEKGWHSVRKQKNVDVFPLESFQQLDWIYWYLRGGKSPYEVVVIDTITMLAARGMKWVLKDFADRDISQDPMTPDKRHWGKLGEMMKDAIIKFRNLDMHVIFLAQEKTTYQEDEETGETQVETHPELSPSPRSVLLSAVSIIGRLYTREVEDKKGRKVMERRMLLGTHPKYVSGNRFEELKRVERNPTLQDFITRIQGAE